MSSHKTIERLMAMVLSAIIVVDMMPVSVSAEASTLPIGSSGEIIAFGALETDIEMQDVPFGTPPTDLNLPGTLMVTVRLVTPEGALIVDSGKADLEPDSAGAVSGSAAVVDETDGTETGGSKDVEIASLSRAELTEDDGDNTDEVTVPVPVTWSSSPRYDSEIAGTYLFTPKLPEGIALANDVEVPTISVTVGVAAIVGRVMAFDVLPDDIRWQNTTTPVFPGEVGGTVDGKAIQIPVSWQTEQDYIEKAPAKGLYVFCVVPSEGYTLSEGIEAPRITVYVPEATSRFAPLRMGGAGTGASPLEITTADQLAEIATLVNAGRLERFLFNDNTATVYLELQNDLDLTGYGANYNEGKGWVPIGHDGDNTFKGNFNGNANIITGLYINNTEYEYNGLLGCVSGGIIQNIGLVDVDIAGSEYVGGVAGYIHSGTVQSCYSTGSISGNIVGGVAGYVHSGTVQSCYATGSVSGNDRGGGVVGYAYNGTVKDCAALNPSIFGSINAGRVVGEQSNSTLTDNYAFSGMTVNGDTVSDSTVVNKNGAGKTATDLQTSSGFSTALTTTPWTYEEGKLPGLDEAVAMPAHIIDISGKYFSGEGTSENPYQIRTPAQLAKLSELVRSENDDTRNAYNTKHYKLTADIDLSIYNADNISFNGGKGWIPIGGYFPATLRAFSGVFDGGGYNIKGLYLNDDNYYCGGLFGVISYGTVKNLGVVDAYIRAGYNVGGISAMMIGTVENCFITGEIGGKNSVGGMIGDLNSYSSSVINCYSAATVTGAEKVGGFIGRSNMGCVVNSYVTGTITGTSKVGGVVGEFYGVTGSKVENCFALNSSVSGSNNVSRVIGSHGGTGTISGNHAYSGMKVTMGGVVQTIIDGTGNNINGLAKTADELQQISGFPNGFASSPWTYTEKMLPGLRGKTVEMPLHLIATGTCPFGGGDGSSEAQSYEISTASQLAKLAELVNSDDAATRNTYNSKYYKLTDNVDLSGYGKSYDGGKGWIPIGKDYSKSFKGSFNGNGKVITGLYINDSNKSFAGLFGSVVQGTVKYLGLLNVNITGKDFVGSIVGSINSSSSIMENCYATGIINGNSPVGGLIGIMQNDAKVINCYMGSGSVNGIYHNIGGIVGRVSESTLENCYALCAVVGTTNFTGGIVGSLSYGATIKNCAALNQSVSGPDYVGRVVGLNSGTLTNNYAFSGMKVNGNTVTGGGMDNSNGTDVSINRAYSYSFWTAVGNWKTTAWNTSIWSITDHKLPILTAFPAGTQSGDGGVYLTQRDLANAIVSPIANPIYNGNQQIPPLTITFEATDLVKDSDYTISITSMDGIDTSAGTKAGEVTITITGKGNFHGAKTNLTYNILPKTLTEDMLTVTGGTFTYSGIPLTPDVTVTDGTTLISGTDYDVTYSNNTNTGVANITVTGKGNYTGTASKSFIIQKAPAPTITWPTSANIVYGSLLSESALVGGSTGYGDFIWKTPKAIPTVTNSGYEVIFMPSAATVNNYELISQTTKIVQIVVTAKIISGLTVDSIDSPTYNGAAQTPFVAVKDGVTTLTSGTDYDVTYSDNIDTGTATVAIKGKGNYTGTMSKNFTIKKRPVTVKANDKIMTRGGSLPTLTYTVDGQLPGEAALVGMPTLSCVADGKTVGSYPITIDLVGVSYTENYEVANPVLVNGTLTVNDLPSSGSDSDSSFGNHPTTTSPEKRPNQPVTAVTSVTALAGQNGRASANLSDITIFGAIVKAQANARAQGKTPNGIGIALNVNLPQNANSLSLSLSQNALQNLVSTGVTRFTINGAIASLSLDLEALKEIQKLGAERITITIKPVHNISSGARAIIGTRPVYDVTISYSKDSKTVNITSLGKGSATLSIPYALGKNETVGYLFGVYVGGKGNATRIPGSCYDTNSNSLLISTGHFSVYGVGYTAPNANFTDIGNHWGKESIDYVFGRNLLSSTSETTFAPNSAMTRGMLVTALGRLAGVDEKAYTTNSFTDVKADSAYRPYIEWAYKKGVVQGFGNQQFAPDRAITREEMSVIFANYAKATGYKLPVTREAAAYADATSISSVYKTAITDMQQAGIMMGGVGNRFNPKSNATRAEVSAMLHRYIKLTIDPATAQGWALNDAGQRLYYMDGKPLIGMQTIEDAKYYFNTDGTLKTGWVKDGDNWHFCDGNKLRTGWLDIGRDSSKRTYYFDTYGNMISGKWLEIDDKWYYFYVDGSLAKNAKVDGYEVDINGVRKRK